MPLYNYAKNANIDNDKQPANNHLIWEVSSSKVYFVDSSNPKVLLKLNPSTGTITTITTRSNKNIARAYHDRSNTIIYFVDCDYDDSTSYIWSMNTSTEAINEITSVPADVFDIWVYDSDLWYYYFGSGGYALETSTIDPDGDGGTLEWTSTGANHYTEIDEGATPNTADYIRSVVNGNQDIFTFPNGLDLSGYDYYGVDPSSQIYEIIVKLYGKGGKVDVSGPAGLGMDTPQTITFDSDSYAWQQATFSGLSLEDSDIDDLEITVENTTNLFDYKSSGSVSETSYAYGICWDGTYFYVCSFANHHIYKYNSSFVYQSSFNISGDLNYPTGICWDGSTYFYVTSYTGNRVYKYNTSFTLQTSFDVSGDLSGPYGIEYNSTDSHFYIVTATVIYEYDNTFTLQDSHVISAQTNAPRGIHWDGTYFYITDYQAGGSPYRRVYVYDSSFSYQTYHDISSDTAANILTGIVLVDSYFYIINESEIMYKYTYSTATIATLRVDINFYGDELVALVMKNHTDNTSQSNNMGTVPGREWDSSQIAIVGDQFWFLWKWSNENAELWYYDVSGTSFTEAEDGGSTTEIPIFNQNGITYDGSNILSFVLGTGTAEVSTIVADAPGTIDDGDYIEYSAISLDAENTRSEKDYYIWFDKVGDESGDPAPVGRTKITVDISAAVDAQDVSDAITSAVNAVTIITAANGSGTSTTVTITNHYNGDVTNIADVDSGLSVATGTPGVDNTYYYYTYNITGDTLTQKGEYNISLMLDRNTNSSNNPPFNLEKGFGLTLDDNALSIFQISRVKGNLYKIAKLDNVVGITGHGDTSFIIAITDTYLILYNDDTSPTVEIWELQDFSSHYISLMIYHRERDYPWAHLVYDSRYLALESGMLVQAVGNVTVKGVTAFDVRFEGYVLKPSDYDPEAVYLKEVDLVNPAYLDLKESPDGSYTGDSDAFIDTLDDTFNYITKGTYDDGQALDNVTIETEKNSDQFLDELAVGDEGTWAIRPKGILDYILSGDDSGLSYTQATPMFDVTVHVRTIAVNEVVVKGAYVDGVLVQSDPAINQAAQDQNGPIPRSLTIAWIQTKATADLYAAAILSRLSANYKEVKFSVIDATHGFVPPGEQLTVANSYKNVSSGLYWINYVVFDDKTNRSSYTVSDQVRWDEEDFVGKLTGDLSDQVGQVAGTVNTINSDYLTSSNVSDAVYGAGWDGVTTIAPSKNAVYDEIETIPRDILPTIITGGDGFALTSSYGACFQVLLSDANAWMSASFRVENAGTYRLQIIYRVSGNPTGNTIDSNIYLAAIADGEAASWNIANNQAWSIAHSGGAILTSVINTSYDIVAEAGDVVMVYWIKSADDGASYLWVHGMKLIKQ